MEHAPAAAASDTPPAARQSWWQRLQHPLLLLVLLTLAGLALRLYKLHYRGYWDDEIISTLASSAPLARIYFDIADYSIHPPLYYMLLHLWRVLGEDLSTLRLLSVVLSAASIPLTYAFGRTLRLPQSAALLAAALLAFAPFQIFHSQQARMYPLLLVLILATATIFVQAWQRGGWWRWVLLGGSVTLGCYTHVYFPFSLLALNLWAVWESYQQRRIDRARWGALIAAQAVGVALFLPFLPNLLSTTSNIISAFWTQPINALSFAFALIELTNTATLTSRLLNPETTSLWYLLFSHVTAVAVLVPTLFYSLRAAYRQPDERSTWLLLHLLIWVPIITATVISLTVRPILRDRYLIGITPALFLLMGWLFVRFARQRSVWLLAGAFGASILLALGRIYPATPQTSDLIDIARYLADAQQPGDAVAFVDWQSFGATVIVAPQQRDVYLLPGPSVWTNRESWQRHMEYIGWHSPQNAQAVAEFAPQYERVWLVLTSYAYDLDYHQQIHQGWLEEHGCREETIEHDRGIVLRYRLTNPSDCPAETTAE